MTATITTPRVPTTPAAPPPAPVLAVSDLVVSYESGRRRTPVVHGVSFTVGAGEVVSVEVGAGVAAVLGSGATVTELLGVVQVGAGTTDEPWLAEGHGLGVNGSAWAIAAAAGAATRPAMTTASRT